MCMICHGVAIACLYDPIDVPGENKHCLDVPQVHIKTNTFLGGQVQQKAFVETLMHSDATVSPACTVPMAPWGPESFPAHAARQALQGH